MYYAERKKKTEPRKLIKELALFAIIDYDNAILKRAAKRILHVSDRTISRYVDELNQTGIEKIGTKEDSPRELSFLCNDEDYDEPYDEPSFDSSMLFNSDPDLHMRKLKRIIAIYILHIDYFRDYLYYAYDSDEYYYDYDELPEKITAKRIYKEICQDSNANSGISLRTIERDINDIYECLNYIGKEYYLIF